MGLRDLFSRGDRKQTLPRDVKLRRRRRRDGGSDVGYWNSQNTWVVLDGTNYSSYTYLDSVGDWVTTQAARVELERNGYESDSYTAPVDSSSGSYGSDPDSGRYSYGGSSSRYGSDSSGSSSYDSGSSGGTSYDSDSSGGSSYSGGSSSSYDSGSSGSSSSDSSSW